MKKHYYGILAVALALSIPTVSFAQYGAPTPPPPQGQNPPSQPPADQGSGDDIPAAISAQIHADYEARLQDVQNNQNYRNTVLEGRYGSTTPPWIGSSTLPTPPPPWNGTGTPPWIGSSTMPRDLRGMPPGYAGMYASSSMGMRMWDASTTAYASSSMMYGRQGYVEGGRGMLFGMFRMRKDDITAQLQTALDNLTEIRGRIGTRIQTEQQDNVDMTGAIALLATADSDIASATAAVDALASYMPAASSTVSASTTVDLSTARTLALSAQVAIEQAQKALSVVVEAIAQAMGLELGQGSSTAASSTTTQ